MVDVASMHLYLRNRFPYSGRRVKVLLERSSPLIYTVWCLSVTSSGKAPISSFVVIWCECLCIIEMLLAVLSNIHYALPSPWAACAGAKRALPMGCRRYASKTIANSECWRAPWGNLSLALCALFVAQCDTAFVCVEIWCCEQQQIWCVYLGIRRRINAKKQLWCYLNELICISHFCLSHSI